MGFCEEGGRYRNAMSQRHPVVVSMHIDSSFDGRGCFMFANEYKLHSFLATLSDFLNYCLVFRAANVCKICALALATSTYHIYMLKCLHLYMPESLILRSHTV